MKAANRVRVREIARSHVTWLSWDAFAKECDASYYCACGAVTFPLKSRPFSRVRFFEIFDHECSRKIGQCAIAVGYKRRIFLDGIQLLPGHDACWKDAMAALLVALGPGHYRYGSRWSIEPRRELTLQSFPAIVMHVVEPVHVQAVDFGQWPSWEAYFQSVSKNARRNAKRALLRNPNLLLRTRRNLSAVADIWAVGLLRHRVASRKRLAGKGTSFAAVLGASVFHSVALRHYLMTVVVKRGRSLQAALSAVEFGRNTFYLSGGSIPQNDGAAWHLILTILRSTFNRTGGTGRFLMGYAMQDDDLGWHHLARFREQCRVRAYETSVLTFSYDPAQTKTTTTLRSPALLLIALEGVEQTLGIDLFLTTAKSPLACLIS